MAKINLTTFRVHYYTQGANGGVTTHKDVTALNPSQAIKSVREQLAKQQIFNAVFTKTKVCKENA